MQINCKIKEKYSTIDRYFMLQQQLNKNGVKYGKKRNYLPKTKIMNHRHDYRHC